MFQRSRVLLSFDFCRNLSCTLLWGQHLQKNCDLKNFISEMLLKRLNRVHLVAGWKSRRLEWVELEFWIKVHLDLSHRLLTQNGELSGSWTHSEPPTHLFRRIILANTNHGIINILGREQRTFSIKQLGCESVRELWKSMQLKLVFTLVCSDFCGFTHLNWFIFASMSSFCGRNMEVGVI